MIMEYQCQYLTMTQRNEVLQIFKKIEELFVQTLRTWETYPADLEIKQDAKPI